MWLETDDNLESTLEGYAVNNLKDESVNALDDVDPSIRDSLYGAAVAYEYEHSMKDLKQTLFIDDWSAVSEGTYGCYERIYDSASQPECLMDSSCEELSYITTSASSWAGVVDVVSVSFGEVRELDIDGEKMVIQRTWLEGPSETSGVFGDQVELYAQFFVNIHDSKYKRKHIENNTTWMDVQIGELENLDYFKTLMVNTMAGQNQIVIDWIDGEQDAEGSCICSEFDYEEKECLEE